MAVSMSNFIVGKEKEGIFKDPDYIDISQIHRYFYYYSKEEKKIDKFEAVSSIVDFFSNVRSEAEKEEKDRGGIYTYNYRKEVPISYENMYELFVNSKDVDSPPVKLITKIAEEDFSIIKNLADTLHRVLRRERSVVPIDKVQQLDTQCIRWLTRQPGRTTAQKAGEKQRLMSIVRYETLDTLENRVFKHFLNLCLVNCSIYIREYKDRFPDHEKVKAVMRLFALAKQLLELPEYEDIRSIHEQPIPNYTLQNNVKYRKIWNLYCQLLYKNKIIENVWKCREVVIKELTLAAFFSHIRNKYAQESKIKHYFWVLPYPDENGHVITNLYDGYFDFSNPVSFKCTTTRKISSFEEAHRRIESKRFEFAFIPSGSMCNVESKDGAINLLTFAEDELSNSSYVDSNIIQTIFDKVVAL